MLLVGEQYPANLFWVQLLLHGTNVGILTIEIIALFPMDLSLFCKEKAIERNFMNTHLLVEIVYIVDQPIFWFVVKEKCPVKYLVVLEIELYSNLGWSVLDTDVYRHDDS